MAAMMWDYRTAYPVPLKKGEDCDEVRVGIALIMLTWVIFTIWLIAKAT